MSVCVCLRERQKERERGRERENREVMEGEIFCERIRDGWEAR